MVCCRCKDKEETERRKERWREKKKRYFVRFHFLPGFFRFICLTHTLKITNCYLNIQIYLHMSLDTR